MKLSSSPATAALAAKIGDPSFTPKRADGAALMALLGENAGDAKAAPKILRKLGLLGPETYAPLLWAALEDKAYPARHHVVRLLGQDIFATQDAATAARLAPLLGETDPRLRRYVVQALAKLKDLPPALEEALLEALPRETLPSNLEAFLEALGHAGSERAAAALRAMATPPALTAAKDAALARIARKSLRTSATVWHDDVPLGGTYDVRFYCRAGFEPALLASLTADRVPARAGAGHVDATWRGPLRDAARHRLWERFAFVFPLAPADSPEASWIAAMRKGAFQALFARLTEGPVRFRFHRDGEGASRGRLGAFAQALAQDPALSRFVNDPSEAPWEWRLDVGPKGASLLVFPKGWDDGRFAWRRATVPASSHPTVAAFLASLVPVSATHIVWDPFVGAGAELIERGLRGPCAALIGTDMDPAAVDAARANAQASGVAGIDIRLGDALKDGPSRADVILTNPPLGRRVRPGEAVDLLGAFLARAARVLVPDGHLVWATPDARETDPVATRLGFVKDVDVVFDIGGFHARAQRWRKEPAKGTGA